MSWKFPYLVISRWNIERICADNEKEREEALKSFGMWTKFDEWEKQEKEKEKEKEND